MVSPVDLEMFAPTDDSDLFSAPLALQKQGNWHEAIDIIKSAVGYLIASSHASEPKTKVGTIEVFQLHHQVMRGGVFAIIDVNPYCQQIILARRHAPLPPWAT